MFKERLITINDQGGLVIPKPDDRKTDVEVRTPGFVSQENGFSVRKLALHVIETRYS